MNLWIAALQALTALATFLTAVLGARSALRKDRNREVEQRKPDDRV